MARVVMSSHPAPLWLGIGSAAAQLCLPGRHWPGGRAAAGEFGWPARTEAGDFRRSVLLHDAKIHEMCLDPRSTHALDKSHQNKGYIIASLFKV